MDGTMDAQRVIEQVRDEAMFLLDLQGRITSWNEGVGLILGWPRSEWIGQPLAAAFTAQDVEAGVPQAEMRSALAAGRADDSRWMRRQNGEPFFALGALTRILGDDGQPVGFLKVLRDFTHQPQAQDDRARLLQSEGAARLAAQEQGQDLHRANTALQECSAALRAVVEGVRDHAIFTLDPEGLISSWHIGAERMQGYSAAEAIGMPFAQLFTADDRACGRPQMDMATAALAGEYQGNGQRLRKDGSSFDVDVVLTALKADDGRLLGFLKLTRDLTQPRRQEREREAMLRQAHTARAEAERANHSKGEFLATISHELRTPLSAILGWATVLERGVADADTVKHGLAAISRNARLQVQLIDDLLDMNRAETGQLRLELQRTELGGVVAAAIDAALPVASAKGVGLRTVFATAPDAVMGDPARLLQVVGKLLSNAIKFTPGGGQVSVLLSRAQGHAQIEISDTGQGIAPEFLARVFDRFQQQDATITRRHGGLGIGLAVVRQLVQLHGGTVKASSAGTGQGATFTVTLPAVIDGLTESADSPDATGPMQLRADAVAAVPPLAGSATTAAPAPTAADAAAQRLDGVSVLIVDDEPDVRAVTMQLLQHAGAHVIAAAGADEALNLLRHQRPHVILSDIGMPLVDGYELLRRVRRLPPDQGGQTLAAAISAYTRPEDRERALAVGYQMHLSKPLAPLDLITAVVRLLKQTVALREPNLR